MTLCACWASRAGRAHNAQVAFLSSIQKSFWAAVAVRRLGLHPRVHNSFRCTLCFLEISKKNTFLFFLHFFRPTIKKNNNALYPHRTNVPVTVTVSGSFPGFPASNHFFHTLFSSFSFTQSNYYRGFRMSKWQVTPYTHTLHSTSYLHPNSYPFIRPVTPSFDHLPLHLTSH